MDRRKKYLIGLDTETCNGLSDKSGKPDLSQSLVYDLGWAVCDKKGEIYETRSYVIYDVYVQMKDLMKSAYYTDKLPKYEEDIKNGTRKLARLSTVRRQFLADMKAYNIDTVFAHNANFDLRALNNTIRYITKSDMRFFFPYGTTIWDTLLMANDTIAKQKSYTRFCDTYGYKTKHKKPRNRATAEILYRYLSGDYDFIESHTGLEDVLIETQILAHCFRQHKKMRKALFE